MPTILKTKNSVTTTVVPTTLQQGELAVNITDKKMWVGNAATTPVQILGTGSGGGGAAGSNTQIQFNSSGALAGSASMTFNGTSLVLTNDPSISGLTVGKGGGIIATNTAFGVSALASNTTGSRNVAIGYFSLLSNTTGGNNIGIGVASLNTNTSGDNNVAVGDSSLTANTTGIQNVALGTRSLVSNTTSRDNTAVGYESSYLNQTGNRNTFIGFAAGYTSNVSGNASNTAIGYVAGYSLTTGTTNTFIGNNSGSSITTGVQNSILGSFNGNQNGLDIRTAANYAVISDGAGTPLISTSNGGTTALQGAIPNGGCGITFPSTQSASSNANTLDDYEEGTWTPSQGAGLTVVGTFSSFGTYIKIGRQVTVVFRLASSTSLAAAGGNIMLGNLPFQQIGTNSVFAAGGAYNNTSAAGTVTQVASTDIYAMENLAASANIFGSATYFANN